tara:strand:- start:279 stop:491 length:213 start_codon:yes stop_codon:yes gene_type:complete
MRDTTRDPKMISDGEQYDSKEVEKILLTAMYCLCHDSAVEEPNEAMKSSQAALNLAHALSTLRVAYRERQ